MLWAMINVIERRLGTCVSPAPIIPIRAHQQVLVCSYVTMRLSSKLGLAGAGAVSVWTAGVVCYHTQALDNSWLSSWRAVRFGRAAYAVSFIIFSFHY